MSAPTLPTDALTELSLPELEDQLLGLAGHLAAAQRRFLHLLAEFDDRAGWAGPGLKSCAHWLCWRIGMSLRTAHEHVRVAHALRELPKIDEAFAEGRISYSKVRAITRVCSRPAPPVEPVSAVPTTPEGVDDDPPPDQEATADSEQILLDLALNGTASHVETVVRATRRIQGGAERHAAERSVSWRWADDGALILRAKLGPAEGAALIAALDAAVDTPRTSVRHPVPEPPDDWQQRSEEEAPGAVVDRVAARRADALVHLTTAATTENITVLRGNTQVVVHIDATHGTAAIAGGPEIPLTTAERLACDAHAQLLLSDTARNRLYLGRTRRLASAAQIVALTVRDGGRCQFAGCTHTSHLHAHHLRHWLRDFGPTDVDNLVLLCTFHHDLVHERGYRIRRIQGGWQSLRPDGTPVPTGGEPLTGNVESLIEIHARAALDIAPRGLTPNWAGERLDPTPILMALLPPRHAERAAA